jgi:hypothetical protein
VRRAGERISVTEGSAQRLPDGPETKPSGPHATQFLALHQTQAMILGQVQLIGSWIDQDTGVALEP